MSETSSIPAWQRVVPDLSSWFSQEKSRFGPPRKFRRTIERGEDNVRYVPWNNGDAASPSFKSNDVTTAKYDRLFITFIPRFLYEMFSRMAYLYFLLQACLAWWETVSPLTPYGPTLALTIVLVVGAVKAIVEDRKRQVEDRSTNDSACVSMIDPHGTGEWQEHETRWRDVRVGDVLRVRDGELIPADLVCLHCASSERTCYVKTTNLDGETNLKVKTQVLQDALYSHATSNEDYSVLHLPLTVECEPPSTRLHSFHGRLTVSRRSAAAGDDDSGGADDGEAGDSQGGARHAIPIDIDNLLLRGCLLKNSGSVLGLVVYAGAESRIQMNAARTPMKVGSFDHFLNIQVSLLIVFQLFLCVACAVSGYVWREVRGKDRYHLALDAYTAGNEESAGLYILFNFFTFWILFSYLVPISLFVTMEIVKSALGFIFIGNDASLVGPDGTAARCRNSGLIEDLGQITYVFSDKTGTLTQNEMRLRVVAVKGSPLGDANRALEDRVELQGLDAMDFFSPRMGRALRALRDARAQWSAALESGGSPAATLASSGALQRLPEDAAECDDADPTMGSHVFDFWLNLAVCHSLLVERNDGAQVYQGPSPDEVALVDCARRVGFEFVGRSSTHTTVSVLGEERAFEVLTVMGFSSERQRMSVIARAPDGTVRLYCKGSDAVLLRMLRASGARDGPLMSRVHDNLHYFATRGLRTLVVASRIVPSQVFLDWRGRLSEAQLQNDTDAIESDPSRRMHDRDARYKRQLLLLHGNIDTAALQSVQLPFVQMQLYAEMERDLELVGVTAIEDKLQEKVPDAIATLIDAGVKVWMITGDKQETAINISVSSRLFSDSDDLLICNAPDAAAAAKTLSALSDRAAALEIEGAQRELVVDGRTLQHILESGEALLGKLAELCSQCSAVCICRATPKQKSSIVHMMRDYHLRAARAQCWSPPLKWFAGKVHNLKGKLLAIGDGANDVAMIQAADVGMGIAGREGRQAANSSDYVISQFWHLTRLLLVHGQLSHYRLRRLIKYSFYKNGAFAAILFYYQIFCGFSGQTLVDSITAAMFNLLFTSLPVFFFALLDKPCDIATLMRFPATYNTSRGLDPWIFWKTSVLHAWADAAICFFVPYLAVSPQGSSSITGVFALGKTVFAALIGTVTIEIAMVARYWTVAFTVVCVLSYVMLFPYYLGWPLLEESVFGTWEQSQSGVGRTLFASLPFWLAVLTANGATLVLRYWERSAKWLFRPDKTMVLSEWERWSSQGRISSAQSSVIPAGASLSALPKHVTEVELPPGEAPAGVSEMDMSTKL